MNGGATPVVKSAMRTLDLIEYVVARPAGVIAQELSEALAIPVSSLSYLLATMVDRTYLHREGRRYLAGPGLDRLRRPQEDNSLAELARPLVTALGRRLDETASLFELDGWELVVTATETCTQTLRLTLDVGARAPLHCVAAGKAILAAMPDADLCRYFMQCDRRSFTESTVTDTDGIRADLSWVRSHGYAVARDEYSIGLSAVGAAVLDRDAPVAAVSVAFPTARFSRDAEREATLQVQRTAKAIEALVL